MDEDLVSISTSVLCIVDDKVYILGCSLNALD